MLEIKPLLVNLNLLNPVIVIGTWSSATSTSAFPHPPMKASVFSQLRHESRAGQIQISRNRNSDSQGIPIPIHCLLSLSKIIDFFGGMAVHNSCFWGVASPLQRENAIMGRKTTERGRGHDREGPSLPNRL